jgi:hypothetical protein
MCAPPAIETSLELELVDLDGWRADVPPTSVVKPVGIPAYAIHGFR